MCVLFSVFAATWILSLLLVAEISWTHLTSLLKNRDLSQMRLRSLVIFGLVFFLPSFNLSAQNPSQRTAVQLAT